MHTRTMPAQPMTLAQWSEWTGQLPTAPGSKSGAVSVLARPGSDARNALDNLSDYDVQFYTMGAVVYLKSKQATR